MKAVLKERSFQLSIILILIFNGTGIAFLFPGLVEYSFGLFILLPIVLGISIGALPNTKYFLWGAIITTILVFTGLVIPGFQGCYVL